MYILKEKSKDFNVSKSFKVCVEIETRRAINSLLIDHEGEYFSKVFVEFCETRDILKELRTHIHHSKMV